MNPQHENTVIIGFDLGHGEFSLASLSMNSTFGYEPKAMYYAGVTNSSQPTAIGRKMSNSKEIILVGNAAMKGDIINLEISFKKKPPFSSNTIKTLQDFCNGVYELLEKNRQIDKTREYVFFVGCPSAWNQDERIEYAKILSNTKLKDVKIEKESRAAFLHVANGGEFKIEELQSGVLVIDIGSSTTDFTFVRGTDDIEVNPEIVLGAGLIDRCIFEFTLSKHEQKDQLEKAFKALPSLESRAVFQCRKTKEQYFRELSDDDDDNPPDAIVSYGSENLQSITWVPLVSKNIMEMLLHKSLPELDNLSWVEAYKLALQRVAITIKEKTSQTPVKILITGGASRMQFTHALCKEIFPESHVHVDSEPESVVSKGLARWGRVFILTEDFYNEAYKIVKEDIHRLVEDNIQELIVNLSNVLSSNILSSVMPNAAKKWNNLEILDGGAMSKEIEKMISDWWSSDEYSQSIREETQSHINKVLIEKINNLLDPICEKYSNYGILPKLLTELKFEMQNIASGKSYSTGFTSSSFSYSYTTTTGVEWGFVAGVGTAVGATAATVAAGVVTLAGPVAWGIAALVALTTGAVGAAMASETSTSTVRKTLGDNQITDLIKTEKPKLALAIQNHYNINTNNVKESLIDDITKVLQQVIIERINRARFLAP